ncbi:hypothetical protein QAD02_003577 [Eretmocerus hayati]|uniref:Uncharacterized protein n=1 Tax=Eretmocerus hayati TaxID=131215 RepID=A0ACC2NNC5_9HYME|nr:hypothetical protein QAD02_003577 [Eretmocerus hayati]
MDSDDINLKKLYRLKVVQNAFQKHVAYSVGYYLHSIYDQNKCKYSFKRGKECIDWFSQQLQEIAHQVEHELKNPIPLIMSDEDEEKFRNCTHCHICQKPFDKETDGENRPVRDHNHFTGEFRSAAHSFCNLNYRNVYNIPVNEIIRNGICIALLDESHNCVGL